MRRDGRLGVALHMLLHLGESGHLITSEAIGQMMQSNPVVVRRTMGGLRDAGIVRSEKGHGGGWSLAKALDRVTLGDVYDALGSPALFNVELREDAAGCLVERAVNRAVGQALAEASALVHARLRALTLADLQADLLREAESLVVPPHPRPRSKASRPAANPSKPLRASSSPATSKRKSS
jgi:DNA-binding IscR family transcriptional regulator